MTIVLALLALIVAFGIGYMAGRARRVAPAPTHPADALPLQPPSKPPAPQTSAPGVAPAAVADRLLAERARIIRSFEAEAARLRQVPAPSDASTAELPATNTERGHLADELAAARGEAARYRQLVVDLENNAPPPLFGPGAPDDLKLIVGIGPVLERMLHQLGVATYRQIAHWSERDIDEFDARLPEFPGRIRRDGWVTQARELHQSKYGETLPHRGH